MTDLTGKVAIVTGGARGLGEGIVHRFAAAGATVVVADLTEGDSLVNRLPGGASRHTSVRLDVSDADHFNTVVDDTVRLFGRLDIICNNAGVFDPEADLVDTPDSTFDRLMSVNVRGVFNGSRAAGKIMREQGSGRIINTASYIGKKALAGHSMYSASKAAVISLTQALAQELGPRGVTANAICPGTMLTPMWVESLPLFTGEPNPNPDFHSAAYAKQHIPAGRMGTGDDVGALAAFLASDDAAFINGAAINLTGGEAVWF